ncbi:MAG: hypothetical protein HQK52_00130 [Oligoflexia bacterium]|nr:hypothetical protein [Oligoflexia bacterium]
MAKIKDELALAILLFQKNQHQQALGHFKVLLKAEEVSFEDQKEIYHHILTIYMQEQAYNKFQEQLLHFRTLCKDTKELIRYFVFLYEHIIGVKIWPQRELVVKTLISLLVENGEIKKARGIFLKHIEFLTKKKCIKRALDFIEALRSVAEKDDLYLCINEIKLLILKNETKKIEDKITLLMIPSSRLEKSLANFEIKKSVVQVYEDIILALQRDYIDFENSLVIREFCIRYFVIKLKQILQGVKGGVTLSGEVAREIKEYCRKVIDFSLEVLLLDFNYTPVYLQLADYYSTIGDYERGSEIFEYIEKTYAVEGKLQEGKYRRFDLENKLISRQLENKDHGFNIMPLLQENIPNATLQIEIESVTASEVSVLDTVSIMPLEEQKSNKNDDPFLLIDKITQIENRIGSYSEQAYLKDAKFFEKSFQRYFHSDTNLRHRSLYPDLIVIFSMMEMYGTAHAILDKIEASCKDDEKDIRQRISALYIRALVLQKEKRLYEAVGVLDVLINRNPLTEDEFVCFAYLKGEILKELKKNSQALVAYEMVLKINPKYRMVDLRVKSLKDNKRDTKQEV